MASFAVADIKHIILGTLFCEKYIQNTNIQHFTEILEHSFNDELIIASFTTSIE